MILVLMLQTAATTVVTTSALQSRRLPESSGVVVSRAHRGILWTHNDSGDRPYLYATDLRGRDRGALLVPGAENVDWEDIALGPCPTVTPTILPAPNSACLYIADTGDNLQSRSGATIYAVPEPDPPVGPSDTLRTTAAPARLRLRYPDGSHDVEAVYVSFRDSAIYLVSKGRAGPVRLYRVPREAWSAGPRAIATAQLVQTLPITPDRSAGRLVTAAAMRPDGRLVAVRTYTEVYFFTPGVGGRLTPSERSVCSVAGLERLGEALDFWDDSTLVLTSESDPLGPGTIDTVRCAP